tara:strand:- start:40 stop:258 length:219 start_codon:yes stop_codon:yes gene_type:complete
MSGIHGNILTHVLNTWYLDLETLALTHLLDDTTNLGSSIKSGSTGKNLPMVKDQSWECLSGSVRAEISVEAE